MARRSIRAENVEAALLAELDRLERRILRIKVQQEALKSALATHRLRKLQHKGAIRKNSFTRLVAQKRILDALTKRGSVTPLAELYAAVNKGHEDQPMPHTTFRSLVHRMKEEGLIVSGHSRGTYVIAPRQPN